MFTKRRLTFHVLFSPGNTHIRVYNIDPFAVIASPRFTAGPRLLKCAFVFLLHSTVFWSVREPRIILDIFLSAHDIFSPSYGGLRRLTFCTRAHYNTRSVTNCTTFALFSLTGTRR